MGTRDELLRLLRLLDLSGTRPEIDSTFALSEARGAFERLASGAAFGKVVLTV
ncbi:MAG: zinc-binding dehydrogenase [Actinomycetes bacterium]